MAKIRSFRAVTPVPELAAAVSSPPNDVLTEREARDILSRDPLSFIRIVRPETMFPEGQDPYAPEVYKKASEALGEMIESGVLVKREDALYLYRLTMGGRSQTGLVALSSVDDYLNGVCRKHENTLAPKEDDRLRHIEACSAQTGPIFLTHRPKPELGEIYSKVMRDAPLFDFKSDDGIGHTVWMIEDSALIKRIEDIFLTIDNTYIADGHHRCAAASRAALRKREADPSLPPDAECNWYLSVLFPSDELSILACNRIVADTGGMTTEELLGKLEGVFTVKTLDTSDGPEEKGTVHMYTAGQWYCLRFKDELIPKDSVVESLDVALLQKLVLFPVFGIENPRNDPRMIFPGGIRGTDYLAKTADSIPGSVAFAMFPAVIEDLMSIADDGMVMPPKSTWFEPKLRSGLFVHLI